jgi:hypothetical protein
MLINHLKLLSPPVEPCTVIILPMVHKERADFIDSVATESGIKRIARFEWEPEEPEAA